MKTDQLPQLPHIFESELNVTFTLELRGEHRASVRGDLSPAGLEIALSSARAQFWAGIKDIEIPGDESHHTPSLTFELAWWILDDAPDLLTTRVEISQTDCVSSADILAKIDLLVDRVRARFLNSIRRHDLAFD